MLNNQHGSFKKSDSVPVYSYCKYQLTEEEFEKTKQQQQKSSTVSVQAFY